MRQRGAWRSGLPGIYHSHPCLGGGTLAQKRSVTVLPAISEWALIGCGGGWDAALNEETREVRWGEKLMLFVVTSP
jgi:hypothetical protein